MSDFSRKELAAYAWGGGILAALGLVLLLATALPVPEAHYWYAYVKGGNGAGWVLLLFGLTLLGLALGRSTTSFFDVERRMDADKFLLSLAAIAAVVAVLLIVLVPRIPTAIPPGIPAEYVSKEDIDRMANFRRFVAVAIVAIGATFGAFPCLRFMKGSK